VRANKPRDRKVLVASALATLVLAPTAQAQGSALPATGQHAEIGQVVLAKTATINVPAIQFAAAQIDNSLLDERLKLPAQAVRAVKADQHWVYSVTSNVLACDINWMQEESCRPTTIGVAVSRDDGRLRTFDSDQLTADRNIILSVWKPTGPVATQIFQGQVADPNGVSVQLIYLGRSGADLKFELRRAPNNGASPPLDARISLTPNADHMVGVFGARLQIDAVDDFSITYEVLQSFG
jgi:hypothetical protein